jgi:hypothetical protein
VTDPETKGDGLISQYVCYKVNTQGQSLQGAKLSSVVRRYSDFVWLRAQLSRRHKGCLIPALPEKRCDLSFACFLPTVPSAHSFVGRFSGEFVKERQRALNIFLARIANHGELCGDLDVHVFLHVSDF